MIYRYPTIVNLDPGGSALSNVARTNIDRTAYIVRGAGVCNTIYVDNFLYIQLAITAAVDRETFSIVDRETITWRDLYRRVSAAIAARDPGCGGDH